MPQLTRGQKAWATRVKRIGLEEARKAASTAGKKGAKKSTGSFIFDAQRASVAGAKGGRISRRRKTVDKLQKTVA